MTFIENGLTYTVENGFLIVEKDGALVFSAIDFCKEGEEPSKEDILQFTDFMMRGIIKDNNNFKNELEERDKISRFQNPQARGLLP